MKYKVGDKLKNERGTVTIKRIDYFVEYSQDDCGHSTDKLLDELGYEKIESKAPPKGTVCKVWDFESRVMVRVSTGKLTSEGYLLAYLDGEICHMHENAWRNWEVVKQ